MHHRSTVFLLLFRCHCISQFLVADHLLLFDMSLMSSAGSETSTQRSTSFDDISLDGNNYELSFFSFSLRSSGYGTPGTTIWKSFPFISRNPTPSASRPKRLPDSTFVGTSTSHYSPTPLQNEHGCGGGFGSLIP